MKSTIVFLMLCLAAAGAVHGQGKAAAADLKATALRCEGRRDPLGIEAAQPRLSWWLSSNERGQRQSAWQVLVASSPELLKRNTGDLWDSGKVAADRSSQNEYAGKALDSGAACHWKVRVWGKDGKPSPWSEPARWTMGLLAAGDWKARWIRYEGGEKKENEKAIPPEGGTTKNKDPEAPSPWLRKTFALADKPARALAFVNVLGYFELYVNGRKVGTDVLAPAVSEYSGRSFYLTYDIAPFLHEGPNCIGLWLGQGWFSSERPGVIPGGPMARAQFDIVAGGKPLRVVTDETWRGAPSGYTTLGSWKWSGFAGERYDAKFETADWCSPAFNDSTWRAAALAPAYPGRSEAQTCPPNRIGKRLAPAAVTDLGRGLAEIDFGTALTGWMRLQMPRLEAGKKITIHYAERKYKTLTIDETPAGPIKGTPVDKVFETAAGKVRYQTVKQYDEFISSGRAGEQFCPRFNYHAFRYAIVEGLPVAPAKDDAEALLIESALEPAGTFECSNELFNRIHETGLWTVRCLDLGGYLVDCPHRERLGYGDGQVSAETCMMNLWMPNFYAKWLGDWRDSQDARTGEIPHTAPNWGGGGGPGWGGTLGALAWRAYLNYDDRRVLEENYDAVKRYAEFLERQCQSGILRVYGGKWDFIGDWLPPHMAMDNAGWPPAECAEFFNNCYRVYQWDLVRRMAEALGKSEEAARWQAKLDEIRPLIHKAFYKADKGYYTLADQPYLAFPLWVGVTPEAERGRVAKALEDDILVTRQGHLDSGMLGTYFLLNYLMETGRNDLIYKMVSQTTYPGWGYMVGQGATTFWEQWNSYWSTIHSCFTSVGGWFYQGVAGIRPDPGAPGFKRIIIKPAVVGDLTWARATHDSPHGRIVSSWKKRADGRLTLSVTIPSNTTARVYVPAKDAKAVTEGGRPPAGRPGVKAAGTDGGAAIFEVESGSYTFESTMP